jgi:diguanylate cyclase (GGDEF)-like protein/PAS domain S-box-containing protein
VLLFIGVIPVHPLKGICMDLSVFTSGSRHLLRRRSQLLIAALLISLDFLLWLPDSTLDEMSLLIGEMQVSAGWAILFATVVPGLLLMLFWQRHAYRHDQKRLQLLENVLDSMPDIVFLKDLEGTYRLASQRARTGFLHDVLGKTDFDLFEAAIARRHRDIDMETIRLGHGHRNEEWFTIQDGHKILLETSKTPLYDRAGQCIGILGVSRDITELRKAQNNLEHIAHHDALTGLANRTLLSKKFDFALRLARRRSESLAVIFLDLDRFKDINDTLGHDVGDLLLQEVAMRLQRNLRDSDLCARLGGDEFILILPNAGDSEELQRKAKLLLHVVSRPYEIKGHVLTVFTSAGISLFPADGNDVDSLIRHADAALHQAKESGRNAYFFYERSLTDNLHTRMTLEQDLRHALEQNQFSMVYQPQFRLGEKQPLRVEALMRWQHPRRGKISPLEFIAIAETTGMILDIGQWALVTACRQFLNWREQGLLLDKIAINVSAIQINAGFADRVISALHLLEFNPRWLELEITETAAMSGISEVTRQINQLRASGVEFSIDDFGTGYSSLSKIKSMPVALLKIDQSFVRDINDDINDYEIARAVILMAKSLGLTVVAEGVETQAQENTLQRLGCDWVQGFLYGMPLTGQEFADTYRG